MTAPTEAARLLPLCTPLSIRTFAAVHALRSRRADDRQAARIGSPATPRQSPWRNRRVMCRRRCSVALRHRRRPGRGRRSGGALPPKCTGRCRLPLLQQPGRAVAQAGRAAPRGEKGGREDRGPAAGARARRHGAARMCACLRACVCVCVCVRTGTCEWRTYVRDERTRMRGRRMGRPMRGVMRAGQRGGRAMGVTRRAPRGWRKRSGSSERPRRQRSMRTAIEAELERTADENHDSTRTLTADDWRRSWRYGHSSRLRVVRPTQWQPARPRIVSAPGSGDRTRGTVRRIGCSVLAVVQYAHTSGGSTVVLP